MNNGNTLVPAYSLRQLAGYFLKLGTVGFGGPVALVGYMHRDLVEQRKWMTEEDYREGLALAQLAPGPLAAQLAIYLGFVHYRYWGATLAGIAFVIPSFLMVLTIGYIYVQAGGIPWMQAIFYGIGAAVIGIIAVSSYKLTRKSLGSNKLLWLFFLVLAVSTYLTESENLWLILAAGAINLLVVAPPGWPGRKQYYYYPVLLLQIGVAAAPDKLMQIAWYFFKAGAFVFGSGLAIVPFLYGGVVKEFGWLNEQQFLDAVAVAMITPGPVVITVGFIGYLVAGFPGATVAALATFLPCYLFTILPAPWFSRYGKHPSIKAFVDGVTAAAVGAIGGAVLVLAKRQLTDITTIILAVLTILVLLRFKKIPEPYLILAAAVSGLLIKTFL
ncbi:chromate transporter [Flavihumibacter petaseus]|uniref:Chromate transporter n=1 Tax=Flavihumibacter petaseus NBRC 106054 TaxID=1220578 RepID=A0A0E9N1Z8_9BACT|nr:chromate transporter [Flavihumibacter petaseus]GAO43859.1 chromate transporter [Flavihumibacter petaseus NBRC 106054]